MTKAYTFIAEELRERLCTSFTTHMLDYGSESQPDEFVLEPEKVAKLSRAILQIDINNLDKLEDVYEYEYDLFPDLEHEQSRMVILNKLKTFFVEHPSEIMYYNDEEGNVVNSPITSGNIDRAIAFYINKHNEQRMYRSKLLKPLEDKLASYSKGREEIPQQIRDYLRPYSLDDGTTRIILDTLDIMIHSENPEGVDIQDPEFFDETTSHLFNMIDGNNVNIEEDVQVIIEHFSSLEERYLLSESTERNKVLNLSYGYQMTLGVALIKEFIRKDRSLMALKPLYLKEVKGAKNMDDITNIRHYRSKQYRLIHSRRSNSSSDSKRRDHDKFIEWLEGEYTDAINARAEEIKSKVKNESVMSFILSEDDDYLDDLEDLEDDIKDDAKEYDKAEREVEKAEDKKNPREVYDSKSKLTNAKRGLAKNSSKFASLLNRTLSLKSENIDKTLSIQHKALRIAVATLVVGGSLAVGPLLIGKIGTVLISSLAIGKYSQVRTDRTKGVIEAQISYLNDKIDEEADPKKKKDLNIAKKELQSKLKELNSKIKRRENIKGKFTKSSGGSSDSDMYMD